MSHTEDSDLSPLKELLDGREEEAELYYCITIRQNRNHEGIFQYLWIQPYQLSNHLNTSID
jgi:hypothetical protein